MRSIKPLILTLLLSGCGGSAGHTSTAINSNSAGAGGEGEAVTVVLRRPHQVGDMHIVSRSLSSSQEVTVNAAGAPQRRTNEGGLCAGQREVLAVSDAGRVTQSRFTVIVCNLVSQQGEAREDQEVLSEGAVLLLNWEADTPESAFALEGGELSDDQREALVQIFEWSPPREDQVTDDRLSELGLDQPRRIGESWAVDPDVFRRFMPAQLREQEGLELSATAELEIFDGTTGLEEGSPCFGNSCHEFTVTVALTGEVSDASIEGFEMLEMSMEMRALIPFDASLPIWQREFRLDGELQGTFQSPQGSPVATTLRQEQRRSRVVTPVPPAGD